MASNNEDMYHDPSPLCVSRGLATALGDTTTKLQDILRNYCLSEHIQHDIARVAKQASNARDYEALILPVLLNSIGPISESINRLNDIQSTASADIAFRKPYAIADAVISLFENAKSKAYLYTYGMGESTLLPDGSETDLSLNTLLRVHKDELLNITHEMIGTMKNSDTAKALLRGRFNDVIGQPRQR